MPIKFRCSYCRQFLGISRSQAGGIVDCPTCGRSIRVPGLDGAMAPMTGPGLNPEDTHLARALDELAALANPENWARTPSAADAQEVETETPQPLLEPIPIEMPLPVSQAPIEPPHRPNGAAVDTQDAYTAPIVLSELAPLTSGLPQALAASPPAVSRTLNFGIALWLVPTATMLLGLALGWFLRGSGSTSAIPAAIPVPAKANVDQTLVAGRISIRGKGGTTQPDIGAKVVLFPEDWAGATRLPPLGFRPADSEEDQQLIAGAVTGMKGALATTAADGSYEAMLPGPGRYHVLILSRLFTRPEQETVTPETMSALQHYLSDPAQTLGQRGFVWQTLQVPNSATTTFDQTFQTP